MSFSSLVTFLLVLLCYVGQSVRAEELEGFSVKEATLGNQTIRWCTTSDEEQRKCQKISEIVGEYQLNWSTFTLQCLQRATVGECIWEVSQGVATIMGICNGRSYYAGKQYGLVPLLAEKYRQEPEGVLNIDYAAVAVVRKDNSKIKTLQDLRGLKSCHSFYGKHAGWNVPVSYLIEKEILKGDDCLDNKANVDNFFVKSCAPRACKKPVPQDSLLCDLCSGVGNASCTLNDPYANDTGALKCLLSGNGDVAFVKHTILTEDAPKNLSLDEFELLCTDGTRKPFSSYRECNWGLVPTRSLMASPKVGRYQRYVHKRFFFNMLNVTDRQTLFNSSLFNGKDLMFSCRTIDLYDPKAVYYTDFMGECFIRTYENQTLKCKSDTPSVMRWCVISDAENAKCNQMKLQFDSFFIKPSVHCVRGNNTAQCLTMIRNGEADIITLDSGDLYTAGKTNDAIPIMYEDYGKGDANYWAVAVAKASDPNIALNNLKGKKSCHTGICRTAGWKVPIAHLVSSKQITLSDNGTNILRDVGNFFSASCAPGALNPKYIPVGGESSPNLCELCGGKKDNKCARNNEESYYGYAGAFRCLVEGGGDLAFVNHLTAFENTDGNNNESWAKNLKSSDYVLLCPDGSRQPLDKYQECNLAKVPSHTVSVSPSKTEKEIQAFINAINKGQKKHSDDSNKAFRMFDSPVGSKDLLFRDGTQELRPVPDNLRDVNKWLANYVSTIEANYICK